MVTRKDLIVQPFCLLPYLCVKSMSQKCRSLHVLHFRHQLLHPPFAAADLHRLRRAGFGAASAQDALLPCGTDAVRGELQRPFRASFHARSAAYALGGFVEALRAWKPAFGIVAPDATERAPFHEDCGADARAVVNGVALEQNLCFQQSK